MMKQQLLFLVLSIFCFHKPLPSLSSAVASEISAVREETPELEWVTESRMAGLSEKERTDWNAYLDRSRDRSRTDRQTLADEVKSAGLTASRPAPNASQEFELPSKVELEWLKSSEAEALAQTVLSYQTPAGGWSKAVDYKAGRRPTGTHWTSQSGKGWHYCGTLDNRATTEQIRFLAWMNMAKPSDAYRIGAERGLRWLLDAQYPNGGWPQVYPLEPGYHEAITLNDGAMLHAIQLLQAAGNRHSPFEWLEEDLRRAASIAAEKGLECLARLQVVVDGKPTVWCAQHDPITLVPIAARLKEPPSLSGSESSDIVKFLMREAPDTVENRRMITAAVDWLTEHKITGLRHTKNEQGKTDYISDPSSTEIYWARFYDINTQQPIFAGGQDGVVYHSFSEMAKNNKVSYDYFTTRPKDVITKELDRWKKRINK